MQLQTTSPESKFPNKYIGVIFIQIYQHLKKLKKYKRVPILWNTVYTRFSRPTNHSKIAVAVEAISIVCANKNLIWYRHV